MLVILVELVSKARSIWEDSRDDPESCWVRWTKDSREDRPRGSIIRARCRIEHMPEEE